MEVIKNKERRPITRNKCPECGKENSLWTRNKAVIDIKLDSNNKEIIPEMINVNQDVSLEDSPISVFCDSCSEDSNGSIKLAGILKLLL